VKGEHAASGNLSNDLPDLHLPGVDEIRPTRPDVEAGSATTPV
jgi:hypothetical protein